MSHPARWREDRNVRIAGPARSVFGTAFATINIVEEGWLHCWTGGVVLVVSDLKQYPELRHLHFVNGNLFSCFMQEHRVAAI